jgi:hypothetical protein
MIPMAEIGPESMLTAADVTKALALLKLLAGKGGRSVYVSKANAQAAAALVAKWSP